MADGKISEILKSEIYPQIDKGALLAELQPRDRGTHYELECPVCRSKARAYIYKNAGYIICNRGNECGQSMSLWDYLQQRDGLDQGETLTHLAELAGYDLPPLEVADMAVYQRAQKRRGVMEEALLFFQGQLKTEAGQEALEYLRSRSYSDQDIEGMELGANPGAAATTAHLQEKGFTGAEIADALKFLDVRDEHKIILPYRDVAGGVLGVWGRVIKPLPEGESQSRKYLPLTAAEGTKGRVPFNLHRVKWGGDVVAVEGYLDALIATARGIEGVIALGGKDLTEAQADTLRQRNVKTVTLCLDSDKAGREGTEKALTRLTSRGITAFVVSLPDGQDPDDFITRGKGAEAFRSAVGNAESGHRWKARQIFSRHDLTTDPGAWAAKREAFDYLEEVRDTLAAKEIAVELAEALNIPLSALSVEVKAYMEGKARDAYNSGLGAAMQEAKEMRRQGKEEKAGSHLEDRLKALRLELNRVRTAPCLPLEEYLAEKREKDKNRPTGLLGYGLNRFPTLAADADGIQPGFYLIGAATNIGKTALLSNLFLDLLQTNPEVKGLYFSLDDNKDVIINRWLSALTGIPLNEIQKAPETPEKDADLVEAYETLTNLAREGKLEIRDISEVQHIDTLEAEIRESAGNPLVVAIDGIYNLEVGKGQGVREENITRANKLKALVDTYRIPVLTTGELRKKTTDQGQNKTPTIDDFMESGKFAYNANLVLLLYPDNYEEFGEQDIPTLKMKFEKNKLSHFKGVREFKFVRSCGLLRDPQSTETQREEPASGGNRW